MKILQLLLSFLIAKNGTKIGDRLAEQVKGGLSPVAPYLRHVGIGLVLMLVSTVAWLAGLLFLLIALFVYLSQNLTYLTPALWTSGASFLIALLLFGSGFRMVRRPR